MNKAVRFTITTKIINLLIASLMFAIIAGGYNEVLEFLIDFPLNFGMGIGFLIVTSYYLGKRMHKLICQKKWNSILTGIFGMILILIIEIIGGLTVGFIEFGVMDSNDAISKLVVDYYFKPLALILVYGGIPTIISCGILGVLISKKTC
jgi:hypothetical protein